MEETQIFEVGATVAETYATVRDLEKISNFY
jgi:hypothetical protein